jgi:small subunit ribosomal protein S16
VGGKKDPVWRVVVADQRSPRDGRVIETIGHYNPQTQPSTVVIDEARARNWIQRGAQPSRAVRKLLRVRESGAQRTQTPSEDGLMEPAETGAAPTQPPAPGPVGQPASAPTGDAEAPTADAEPPTTDAEAPTPPVDEQASGAPVEPPQAEEPEGAQT